MSDTPEWDEWMLEQGAASPSGPREALSGEVASPAAGLPSVEELYPVLHEIGGEFCSPFTANHPVVMHASQAAAIREVLRAARLSRSGGEAPPDWAITDPAEREKAWRERADR